MGRLRRLCEVDLVRRRLAAACAHSETMVLADLAEEDRVVVTAEVLPLFRLGIGSEARGFRREADEVVVAGDGRHIEAETGWRYW